MKQLFFILTSAVIVMSISCKKEMNSGNVAEEARLKNTENKNKELPIKGSYHTSSELLQGPPFVKTSISGTGQSSHLGKSTFFALSTLNLTTPPPFTINGTAIFTAANGNEFYTAFTGTAIPNGQAAFIIQMTHTISGGTGRFSEATGSFVGNAIGAPGESSGFTTYTGFISY